jgi:hypothetical protein
MPIRVEQPSLNPAMAGTSFAKTETNTHTASAASHLQAEQLTASPRKDVLAIDGKIYVETTPEQLLYERKRSMKRQHQQPAWVNNLVQSAIFSAAISAVITSFELIREVIFKGFNSAIQPKRLKQHALEFAGCFALSTVGSFVANALLQAYRNKENS